MRSRKVNLLLKKELKIYFDTWVVTPLQVAIDQIENLPEEANFTGGDQ